MATRADTRLWRALLMHHNNRFRVILVSAATRDEAWETAHLVTARCGEDAVVQEIVRYRGQGTDMQVDQWEPRLLRTMIDELIADRASCGPYDRYKWEGLTARMAAYSRRHEELTGEPYPAE